MFRVAVKRVRSGHLCWVNPKTSRVPDPVVLTRRGPRASRRNGRAPAAAPPPPLGRRERRVPGPRRWPLPDRRIIVVGANRHGPTRPTVVDTEQYYHGDAALP